MNSCWRSELAPLISPPCSAECGAVCYRPCYHSVSMDGGEGPSFGAMIRLVAVVVAAVILVFFGIGYALGRLFL